MTATAKIQKTPRVSLARTSAGLEENDVDWDTFFLLAGLALAGYLAWKHLKGAQAAPSAAQ